MPKGETQDMTLLLAVTLLGQVRNTRFNEQHAQTAISNGKVTVDGLEVKDVNRLVYPNSRVGVDWKWVDGKQR